MRERIARWTSSYRLRIAVGSIAIVAVLAAGWSWSLYAPLDATVAEQQRSHLRAIARTGALFLAEAKEPVSVIVERLVEGTDLRATIVATDGAVLADSQESPARMADHAGRPEIRAALAGRVGYATRVSATQGIEQLYVAVPATYAGRPVALRVSESLASIGAAADQARQTGLLVLAISIVVAVVVAVRISGSMSAPLLRLKEAAEQMAAGDLARPVPHVEGELAGLSDALADLAARVRSTIAALEGEQAALRTALDGLEDAVFVLEGDTVRFANVAASRMFKAPGSGWRRTRLADSGLPASLRAATTEMLVSGQRSTRELGPDPRQRFQRVTVVPLNATEECSRALLVVQDTTERERLDAMRRDFVTNVSHELKTPTAAIQLLAESAASAATDGDEAQAVAFAMQMKGEAERLRRMVLDLLDLSRLEAAPAPGSLTDVRDAVSLAMAAHRPAAQAAGLTTAVDESTVSGVDLFAAADPTDVAIALDNLLANAISYTEHGGVTVSLGADRRAITVRVTDTGLGIPAEHLPRVFERFYRVDSSRGRDTGGTGLGLSLVRHAIERSGGEVDIESTPGGGTTVTVRLPRAR